MSYQCKSLSLLAQLKDLFFVIQAYYLRCMDGGRRGCHKFQNHRIILGILRFVQ